MSGTLHKTICLLQEALADLEAKMPLDKIERTGIMVHKAMSADARSFHTPEHIFHLAGKNDPIRNMAALFHDIVYFSVDRGFIPEIEEILAPWIESEDTELFIKSVSGEELGICLDLFGFESGQKLPPFSGMNEFLSALVFSLLFYSYLPVKEIIRIVTLIEMTIPFRKADEDGKLPATKLAERLERTLKKRKMECSEAETTQWIQEAVLFANKDVENFSEVEEATFLDNTWKLLPETNPSLRIVGLYTVQNYRIALQKMSGFMNFLDPGVIYSSYRGVPDKNDFQQLEERAQKNIFAAREYLGIKLLTTGILEAISLLSGEDAPIALFLGDLSDEEAMKRFISYLPHRRIKKSTPVNSVIYDLLAIGRRSRSNFDLKKSPLAAYFYLSWGTGQCAKYLKTLNPFFNDQISAEDFLKQLPAKDLVPVIHGCASVAFTRKQKLENYLEKLEP